MSRQTRQQAQANQAVQEAVAPVSQPPTPVEQVAVQEAVAPVSQPPTPVVQVAAQEAVAPVSRPPTQVVQVVQPIKAPVLSSFSRLAIAEFRMAYDRYVISTKAHGIAGNSELECLDPKLLIVLAKQYLQMEPSTITNENLKAFLKTRLNADTHHTEEGIKKIFSEVKMNLSEKDPIQRVTSYNMSYLTTLSAHGLEQLTGNVGFRKQVVSLLLDGVRPTSLRQLMRQKTKTSEARSDPRAFFELLEEWAPLQDVFHSETIKTAKYVKERTVQGGPSGKQPWKKPRGDKSNLGKKRNILACLICGKANHRTTEHRGATKEDLDKAFSKYREEKTKVCTKPVRPCANISAGYLYSPLVEEQGERWEPKLKKSRLEDNDSRVDVDVLNEYTPTDTYDILNVKTLSCDQDSDLPRVRINESISVPCHIDDGADLPVISGALWRRLNTDTTTLNSPLRCELPFQSGNNHAVICTMKTSLNLELYMPKAVDRPIKRQSVDFIVADVEMPIEILLGKSFLKDLGIDVEHQLTQLAQDQDISKHPSLSTSFPEPRETDTADTHDFQGDPDTLKALDDMIERAFSAGLPREYGTRFHLMVRKYDIWRTRLGSDPPADVPPMKITLKPGAPSLKAANRRYPPMYREFMNKRLAELEEFGLVFRNNTSRYSSAVHVVPKVDKPTDIDTDLRWTVDLREINKWTDPITWPMPNLDVISESVSRSRIFGNLDFLKGYWQMPLHEASRELLSMVTDRAVYTPTRVIQGSTDAVMYFQSTMERCFESLLFKELIIWLDDFLVHAPDVDAYLTALEAVFKLCDRYRLKLNPRKCSLFAREVKFCGKIFSAAGVKHDPKRISSLTAMPPPTNAAELQQYLCALNWMRSHIPDFARVSKPLRALLERTSVGRARKASVLKHIPLQWNKQDIEHFDYLNKVVADVVILGHPSPEADLFLFTDASDNGWGAALFQIQDYDPAVPIEEQSPKPIYFLSGCFNDASHRWSVCEKESFAIVEAVERLDFLLIRAKPFYIITDHRNLQFIFGSNTHLRQATRHKISRWALSLTSFNYHILHIDGERNVWADLLSRWGQPPAPKTISVKTLTLRPFEEGSDFAFPSLEEVWKSQRKTKCSIPTQDGTETRSDSHVYVNNKPWIPEDAEDLLNRVLIVSHCGLSGHRGVASTTRMLQKYCYVKGLRTKVLNFMKSCLLCLQTKGGNTIPRPFGRTLQAEAPNEVLHFDFYYVGEATNDWEYILVLKDGLSHFVELVGSKSTSSDVTVEAILGWFKRYGIVPIWVSDQPTHFRNTVIADLTKRMQCNHHFTTAYTPWANGSVERANRDLGSLIRILLAEFNMPIDNWPQVLPIIQYIMNQTPTESLYGFAPIQVFMGREPTSPVREIFDPHTKTLKTVEWNKVSLQKIYADMKKELSEMHRLVRRQSDKIHEQNQRRNAKKASFSIGDFVLFSRVDTPGKFHKHQFIWRGPFRVIDTKSDHVFVIEHLTKKTKQEAHSSRLKFYHDNSLNITAELEEHVAGQGFLYKVNNLKAIEWNRDNKRWEVLTQWEGFPDEDTWEPFTTLLKDIPEELCKFMSNLDRQTLKKLKRKHKKAFDKLTTRQQEYLKAEADMNGK